MLDATRLLAELEEAKRQLILAQDERDRLRSELDRLRPPQTASAHAAAILNAIADPVFVKDEAHRMVVVNDSLCEFVGQPREALIGKTDYDFLPAEEADVFWKIDQEVLETGVSNSNRETLTDSHGRTHVLVTKKSRLRTPSGEPLLVGVIRDVTESERVAAELERERNFSKRVIDNVPAGIAFMDRDLVFRTLNLEYSRLLRISPERIVGRSIPEVFGAKGAAQIVPLLRGVLDRAEPYRALAFPFAYEVDGAERLTYWDFTYQPQISDGRVEGVLILAVEVSARVERERLQQELIARLQEVDTMKDQFISILSHELRTPINAIGSILQDEIAGPLTAEQHAYLGRMLIGADSLLALVNDLLDMSRIQAGKFQLRPDRMRFDAVLSGVLDSLTSLAAQKHQTMRGEIAGPLPEMVADEHRVQQILVNLIGNAVKFTPEGGNILVRARLEDDAIRCEVEDTGIGLAPEDRSQLFKPFTQVDMSATRKAGGTGLGLSISKALIEAHGGSIGVESAGPGQGSTFWFTLPLKAKRKAGT